MVTALVIGFWSLLVCGFISKFSSIGVQLNPNGAANVERKNKNQNFLVVFLQKNFDNFAK
jgi:hypothetical protein